MEYFIIHQDERIPDPVQPAGIARAINTDKLKKEETAQLPVQISVNEKSGTEYVDYIERPVPLVSDKLKQLLEKYDQTVYFKPVILTGKNAAKQRLYWLVAPDSIHCLSGQSQTHKNGAIKTLVIDPKKAQDKKIFKISGILEKFIIVTLDVAESILRNDLTGIRLKKVEKES